MDPITTTRLVRDRTQDLQQVADQIRQERALRSGPPADVAATSTGPAEAHREPAPASMSTKVGGCAPAEPAL